jgi:6-pyruvoyltetrahydropterin/6-carboxytetrahydropterin synthase
MKFEIKQQFQIEAARFLPQLPSTHPCSRMHGHSFVIILTLQGALDPKIGWVRDYHEIHQTMNPLLQSLDHKVLNEVPGLENPTSENLCLFIYNQVKPKIMELKAVTVKETSLTECTYPV